MIRFAKHWAPIVLIGTILSGLAFSTFGLLLFGLDYALRSAPVPVIGLLLLLLTHQIVSWVEETLREAEQAKQDAVLREKVVILIDYLREKVAKLAREGS